MPVHIDNRAALTGETADPEVAFHPFASNATVVPRFLASDGPQTFPTPGTPEWGRRNRRRGELIRRKVRGGLSRAEEEELEWLQRETLAAVDRAFPRPPVDQSAVAGLEMRLKKGPELGTP